MYDVVGIGTVLIDFTSTGRSGNGNPLFECNPGGSVANFLTAVARQGGRCGVICKLGNEMFGRFLEDSLRRERIDTEGLVYSPDRLTTGAFVQLREDGEHDFLYYKKDAADMDLSKEDVNYRMIDGCEVLHVTSFIMTGEKSYETVLDCIRYAKDRGKLVTYDINWRPISWEKPETGMERVRRVIGMTDILKVSLEELEVFAGTGEENWEEGAKKLLAMGPKLVLVTFGADGCAYCTRTGRGRIEGERVRAVDTTGAGDCCFGVFVQGLLKEGLGPEIAGHEKLMEILGRANQAAAFCVQHTGGLPSMPYGEGYEQG